MKTSHLQQFELEFAIAKQLEFGIEKDLADRLGVSPGLISQYLNAHDERESPIYKAAAMFSEWIDLDLDNGRAALELFNHFVRRALPGKESLCIDQTREKAFRESAEATLAEAAGKSTDECIREIEEEIGAKIEHLEALRAKAKREIRGDVFEKANSRLNGNGPKAVRK